jgi:hypothetical protein
VWLLLRHLTDPRPASPLYSATATQLAQPTRKSLDAGLKALESAARPDSGLYSEHSGSLQSLPVAGSTADLTSPTSLAHSASTASLSSESDLALLLGSSADAGGAGSDGSTPLVFGSFPAVVVPLPSAAAAAAAATGEPVAAASEPAAAATAAVSSAEEQAAATKATKLSAASHEFYPQAYLAAAATAIAAHTISSSIARSSSPAAAAEAADEPAAAEHPYYSAAEPAELAQAQPHWVMTQHQQQQAPPPMTEEQWVQCQQQQTAAAAQWAQWQQGQQGQQAVPVPVYFPVLIQPYPSYYPGPQSPSVAMMPPMMMPPDQAAAAASGYHAPQQQQQLAVCPPSPGGYSLPADTGSLMSTPTAAGWQHNSLYSSGPGSSASSVVSFSSSRTRHSRAQQVPRDAGTVTVSALSCVKDAAGALAKVVTRHGSCLLLSLAKPGDEVAQATHVAAKSLAVARFYVNAHMAAAGAAGIDAAAALTGAEPGTPASLAAAAVDDELVFMPYQRSSRQYSAQYDGADAPLGFVVAKASTRDLQVVLPPPVGIPACMQGKQQSAVPATAGASASSSSSAAPLLKAGANTDVSKLSNAVIHNILGRCVLV